MLRYMLSALVLFVFLMLFFFEGEVYQALFFIGFSWLFLLILHSVFSSGKNLVLMSYGLYFLFLYLIPGFFHVRDNSYPFPWGVYTDEHVMGALLITLVFFVATTVGYFYGLKPQRLNDRFDVSEYVNLRFYYWFSCLVVAYLLCNLLFVGYENYLMSRLDFTLYKDVSPLIKVLCYQIPRLVSFVFLMYSIMVVAEGRVMYCRFILVLAGALFLVVNWPLALPRFFTLGYLLALSVLLVDYRTRKAKFVLLFGFSLGLVVILPFLNMITRGRDFIVSELFSRYVEHGDFDGFQSVANVYELVEREGLFLGKQLLTALFLFVPRFLWADKSDSTGSLAAESMGYEFTRVSSPLPSEFYVDFGFLGLIVLGLIFGRLMQFLDVAYNSNLKSENFFIGVAFGFSFILYRGSLVGVLAPCLVVFFFSFLVAKHGFIKNKKSV